MTLTELIHLLEGAPSGDPSLDFWVWWWGKQSDPRRGPEPPDEFAHVRIQQASVPQYSSSIDIAATLVPDGYHWRIESHQGHFVACVAPPIDDLDNRSTEAKTPAAALCAAALRCRLSFVNDVMRGRH
ncbi:MAG: hypothetical protein WCF16_09180 [Alphaproteobacteria bacterium]